MQKPMAWGLRSGGVNIREAARNAARREGMSLNAWFAQAVGEYAAEIDVDPADLTEDEHAEAIAAKLRPRAPSRPTGGRARLRPNYDERPARPERPTRGRQRAAQAEEALIEKAFRHLEDDGDRAPPPPKRQRPEPEFGSRRPVSAAPVVSAPITSARRPALANAVAEISRRQQALEEMAPPSRAAIRFTEDLAGSATLESLRTDIAALANQVHGLRREQAQRPAAAPVCNLDKLSAEIAAMSAAMRGVSERSSTAPLESAIRNLTQQIEASRSDGIRETVLQPLERLVGDLRLALAEADPRTTIRGLEGEVKKIGTKLDDLGRGGFNASALNVIDTRTREIRELLTGDVFQAAPVERIARQLEALSERFDHLREAAERRLPAREEGDLAAVADEIRLLTADRSADTLSKIESQLAALGSKVEQALSTPRDDSRYQALTNRINDVQQELAERMARTSQVDMHALEKLVIGLAEKIDTARQPEADNQALEALQRQISDFAARLDQANAGIPSLVSLERTIGDLFAELERTREISYAAAEKAARDVLSEALPHRDAGSKSPEMAHELLELRTMQDEAGRRTFSTLNAVHETLERVVDRLALVETEIADVRNHKPELLASGPAPNFAPATARMPDAFVASRPAFVQAARAAAREAGLDDSASTDIADDFLIEPGRGLPASRSRAAEAERPNLAETIEMAEAGSGRSGFIAAARRAAQAAQMESATALHRASAQPEAAAGLVDQTRSFITQHKRPVVLSIAALFLAMGAYAVVKTVSHAPVEMPAGGKPSSSEHSAPLPAPVPSEHSAVTLPNADAPKPAESAAAPAAAPAVAPAPALTPAPAPQPSASFMPPGADPIVTGTVGRPPQAAAAPEAPAPAVLQKLAEAGNAKAQYELATAYAAGHGVEHDLHLAAQWYEKAARQGLAPAEYRLGSLYEKGLGLTRDSKLAMGWYRKAADQGNVRAMHNLAVLTAEGGDNGKPDYANAAQWFRKAAEYGVRDSQYNVAILLARGLGVPQNLTLSYVWFAVAAAQGDDDAGNKRDDVGARLNAADLAAAKATVAAFRAKTPDPAANDVTAPPGGWTLPATSSRHPKISRL